MEVTSVDWRDLHRSERVVCYVEFAVGVFLLAYGAWGASRGNWGIAALALLGPAWMWVSRIHARHAKRRAALLLYLEVLAAAARDEVEEQARREQPWDAL